MLKLYLRLKRSAQTINQLNRIHIALENRLTPLEIDSLAREYTKTNKISTLTRLFLKVNYLLKRSPTTIDQDHSKIWLNHLVNLQCKSGKKKPETFVRKRLSPHSILLSDPSVAAEDKTLIICFTGAAQRLMMPLGVLLQHFNAKKTDIAVIIYPDKANGYRNGLKGVGDSFKETLNNLNTILPSYDYAQKMSIGTSGGAIPALLATLRFNYTTAITVGINSPLEERWGEELEMSLAEFSKKLLTENSPTSYIYFIYGREHEKDKQSSLMWNKQIDASTVISIEDENGPVGHTALRPLLLSGKLEGFFKETLNL